MSWSAIIRTALHVLSTDLLPRLHFPFCNYDTIWLSHHNFGHYAYIAFLKLKTETSGCMKKL